MSTLKFLIHSHSKILYFIYCTFCTLLQGWIYLFFFETKRIGAPRCSFFVNVYFLLLLLLKAWI